jgi:hypothetical protein
VNKRVDHALIPCLWTSLDIQFDGHLYDSMDTYAMGHLGMLHCAFGPGGAYSKAAVPIP